MESWVSGLNQRPAKSSLGETRAADSNSALSAKQTQWVKSFD